MKLLLFLALTFIFYSTATNAQLNKNKRTYHSVHPISSIKQVGDSLAVNQQIILQDKNLGAFISDLQKSSMILQKSVKSIPIIIKDFLASFANDGFSIVDPGKNWNCCDGSWDDSLPNRELINVGADGHLFMITYLTGGIGVGEHIILISYNETKILDFWAGDISVKIMSKNEIIKYLINEKEKHWNLNKYKLLI